MEQKTESNGSSTLAWGIIGLVSLSAMALVAFMFFSDGGGSSIF